MTAAHASRSPHSARDRYLRARAQASDYVIKRVAAVLALGLVYLCVSAGCRRPAVITPITWAGETRASADGIDAILRINPSEATSGTRIDIVLDVQSSFATPMLPPVLQLPGLVAVDFIALPVTLVEAGRARRQYHWVFQAEAPQSLPTHALRLSYTLGKETRTLQISLPTITIHSAFAPGSFSDQLPELEEHDAL